MLLKTTETGEKNTPGIIKTSYQLLMVENGTFTFQFVVFRVCREQDIREELLKAVAGIAWPVLHVSPH